MQFAVPQFIDIEDKIVGPLTLRQFLTIVAAAAVLAGLYFSLPFIFFIIAAIPVALLAGLLTFFKINGRPFYFFLIHLTGYLTRPRLRIWRRDATATAVKAKPSVEEHAEATQQRGRKLPRTGLKRLSYVLDHAPTSESVYAATSQEQVRGTASARPPV